MRWVALDGKRAVQLGRVFLSYEGNIDNSRHVYLKSKGVEIFGVIIHEMDLAKDPETIEEWFTFIKSGREKIKTVVKQLLTTKRFCDLERSDNSLIFLEDIVEA